MSLTMQGLINMSTFIWYPKTIDSNSATLDEFVDKVFYGVRQDAVTGRATIEKIVGDEPIRLPDEVSNTPNDYRNWMWTTNTFRFNWDANTGRLLMEVI